MIYMIQNNILQCKIMIQEIIYFGAVFLNANNKDVWALLPQNLKPGNY